eukprot:146139-Lingulodinium_polyedra.AAC.1
MSWCTGRMLPQPSWQQGLACRACCDDLEVLDDADVYVGRGCPRLGQACSQWANPFKVGRDGPLDLVLSKFDSHL